MKDVFKFCLIAHEFGLFPGHGGIASYLYNLAASLLKNHPEVEVHVICNELAYHRNCNLIPDYPSRFKIWKLKDDLWSKQHQVTAFLKEIRPNVVEVADFEGLAVEALLARALGDQDLAPIVFVSKHHTSSQEIFEWSSELSLHKDGPYWLRKRNRTEAIQFLLSDANIAPSLFLAKYVSQRYNLGPVTRFCYPYLKHIETQEAIRSHLPTLEKYPQSSFNVVLFTRFDNRKYQSRLIDEFQIFLDKTQADAQLFMAGNCLEDVISKEDYNLKIYKTIRPEYRERIHFYDFLPLERQNNLIAIADLSIMPSTFENFPVAMMEKILRGIPSMGSIYTGVADMVGDTAEDMTFDPFRRGSLAEKIENFFHKPKEVRQLIAKQQLHSLNQLICQQATVEDKLSFFKRLSYPTPSQPQPHPIALTPDPELSPFPSTPFFMSTEAFLENHPNPSFHFLIHPSSLHPSGQAKLNQFLANPRFGKELAKFVFVFTPDIREDIMIPPSDRILHAVSSGCPLAVLFVDRDSLPTQSSMSIIDAVMGIALQRENTINQEFKNATSTYPKSLENFCLHTKNKIPLEQFV